MSEYDYDENWAPDLLAAGITPHYDPLDTRGLLAQIIENLGGGGGGITEIESTDGSITVTDPTGPTTDLSVNALGAGTVTSVSVVSTNGLAGTVATATTTPAITLSTTVTGLIKGNGTAISAASAGTDYPATGVISAGGPTGSGTAVPAITWNANGQLTVVTTAATVGSVAATNGSIVIAGSGTAPTIGRAALTGDATASAGSNAMTVVALNGTTLSGLATGLLKNTTGTGVPVIATAGTDYPATGVIVAGGPIGSTTTVPVITWNANGQLTAVSSATIAGTVSTVSVVTANGFAGSVATATTTPAITLTTTITGIIKGNGTAISAAVAGTDYPATGVIVAGGPTGSGTAVPVITYNANGQLTVVTTAATVGSVAATDATIVIGGTATAPTVGRAALTGDVTTSVNVATLQNTANVQSIIAENDYTAYFMSLTFQ